VKKISLRIEKIIVAVLILLMIIVLLLATYELGKFLFNAIFINESGLTLGNVMELFGGFLLVLIGIAVLIIALAGAYFLIKKAGIMTLWHEKETEEKNEAKSKAEDGHVS